jgi:hypothetical protein
VLPEVIALPIHPCDFLNARKEVIEQETKRRAAGKIKYS